MQSIFAQITPLKARRRRRRSELEDFFPAGI